MNKSKHLDVAFCGYDKARQLVNNPQMVSIDEFDDDCFEVSGILNFVQKTIKIESLSVSNVSKHYNKVCLGNIKEEVN